MSLQAKIEAVIYASEEPVTLPQLVGLLGHEAQRELDRLAERQQSFALVPEGDTGEGSEELGDDPGPGERAEMSQERRTADDEPDAVGDGDAGIAAAADKKIEAAEKRLARERERALREYVRGIVDTLMAEYATSERGVEVREVAGGYRMATKPEYHDAVRGFAKSLKPPLKLSLQALETLAVVAYKQPVTSPEISEIRGVDSGGVLGSLLGRKLITTAGRKQVIGRPILYKTTKDFLLRFGLKDVNELPSIEEFEKLAGELVEQEEIPMLNEESAEERITHEDFEEEKHATEPQADGDSDSLESDDLVGNDPESDDRDRPEAEQPTIDGRMSGLPPPEYVPGDDPSADEAEIQEEERA